MLSHRETLNVTARCNYITAGLPNSLRKHFVKVAWSRKMCTKAFFRHLEPSEYRDSQRSPSSLKGAWKNLEPRCIWKKTGKNQRKRAVLDYLKRSAHFTAECLHRHLTLPRSEIDRHAGSRGESRVSTSDNLLLGRTFKNVLCLDKRAIARLDSRTDGLHDWTNRTFSGENDYDISARVSCIRTLTDCDTVDRLRELGFGQPGRN
jgi:hypothetical protein